MVIIMHNKYVYVCEQQCIVTVPRDERMVKKQKRDLKSLLQPHV